MTTVTTVLGLVPLILFGGPLWYGMAYVIAFGWRSARVLRLGVVPVLYSLMFGFGRGAAIFVVNSIESEISPATTA